MLILSYNIMMLLGLPYYLPLANLSLKELELVLEDEAI